MNSSMQIQKPARAAVAEQPTGSIQMGEQTLCLLKDLETFSECSRGSPDVCSRRQVPTY